MTGRIGWTVTAALAAAALLALGVTATRPQPAGAVTNCSTSTAGLDGDEITALQMINAFRTSNGQPALLVSPALNQAAAWKSADSSNQSVSALSHTDSLGRSPYARAIDCGYPGGAGENIGWGYPSASSVVQAWISSPGHRNNLLSNYYRVMGIGRTGSGWTLDMGLTVDSGAFQVPSGGGSAPPPPQATAPAATATPATSNPPAGSAPPPANTSSPVETGAQQPASQPAAIPGVKTVLPGGLHPQWKLPANVPVKRATIQMVAFE